MFLIRRSMCIGFSRGLTCRILDQDFECLANERGYNMPDTINRVRTLLPVLLICLIMPMGHATSMSQTMSHPTNTAATSDAQKAFEKLKTLAGTWQGNVMGMPVNVTLRVTSSGN